MVAKYAAGGSTIPSEATKYAISNENNIIKKFYPKKIGFLKKIICEKKYILNFGFLEFSKT